MLKKLIALSLALMGGILAATLKFLGVTAWQLLWKPVDVFSKLNTSTVVIITEAQGSPSTRWNSMSPSLSRGLSTA